MWADGGENIDASSQAESVAALPLADRSSEASTMRVASSGFLYQKASIACCHPAGPFCAKLAADCASGTGAICSITDRNLGNFGGSRKRSNSSRRGGSAEIFGESARAFWISP